MKVRRDTADTSLETLAEGYDTQILSEADGLTLLRFIGSGDALNTFVARVAPKWTIDDETELTLEASALVGEIDSRLPGFVTDSRAVWGVDAVFVKGPMELRSEVLQWFGKSVPIRFTSGGASNRVTSFSTEAAYTIGPIKYRGQYSASFDANPDGRQNIWSLGGGIKLTPNMNLFAEYTEWTVDGHATLGDFTVLEGPQFTLYWQY